MEDLIFLVLVNFIIDFAALCFVNKINHLSLKLFQVFLLQILTVCATLTYHFLNLKPFMLVVIKFVSYFVVCVFSASSYKPNIFMKQIFSYIFVYFSISGFIKFEVGVIDSSFSRLSLFLQNRNLRTTVEFLLLTIYLLMIVGFANIISKNKFRSNYMANVSFFIFGKHIRLRGLLDSGNRLYDTVTGKPVIIISKNAFEKFFPEQLVDLKNFRQIRCVVVGDNHINLPIVGNVNVQITRWKQTQTIDCSVGVSSQSFGIENSNNPVQFDCLLHRDFL